MPRATQVAVDDHRTPVHLSLQAVCVACLLFSLDGREPAVRAAPPGPAVPRQASATDAAAATVAMRPDVGVVHLGMVVVEHGNVTRVVAGALRAEVTADRVALADDRFESWIIAAVRATPGDAWLFLAEDGTVARARSFLGPLEPLGHVPQPVDHSSGSLTASQGRLAIRTDDPHATLWTTDGSAPVAPAHDLPPGIVVSAAFADADHGMIVVEGGALFLTRDGMRSFVRIDLADAAAASVAATSGALYVTTSSGIAVFDRDGALRTGPGAAAVVVPSSLALEAWLPVPDRDAALYRRVFTAALRRYGGLVAEAFYGAIAADGRPVVAIDREHVHTLVALDGPPPDLDLTALEHTRACLVSRWGDDLALACLDGLFRAGADLRPVRVTAEAGFHELALSSDGIHAAWPCDTTWASLCLLDGSRVIHHPRGSDRLLGLHGGAAVVWRQSPDAPALVLIDAATGAEPRSFAPGTPPVGTAIAGGWELTADGAAATAVATAPDPARGESWLLRLALSDGAVTTVRLPRGATRAGFVSAERGVAAGEDASTLWLTSDGGATWHARYAKSGVNRSIHCRASRCVVDDLVLVSFDRFVPTATERVLMSPGQRVPPPVRRWPGLECKVNDAARPARDRDSLCGGELDVRGRLRFHNPGADVQLTVTEDGKWTVAWRGRDWRGAYTAHAAGLGTLRASIRWLELLRATREGVVISQTGDGGGLVWMPADGSPAPIGGSSAVDDVLTLPTGELAVLLRFKGQSQPEHDFFRPERDYYQLLVVDRTGRVRAQRTYFWEWGRNGAIAFLDGTAGVQWAETDPARPRWFLPIDPAAPSRAFAPLEVAPGSVCKAPPGPADAVSIRVEGPERQDTPPEQGKAIARLYWRGDERPCLQAIEARQPRLEGRDVFVAASAQGDLRTVLDLPDVQKLRSLRCEPATEQGLEPHGPAFGDALGAWADDGRCPRVDGP